MGCPRFDVLIKEASSAGHSSTGLRCHGDRICPCFSANRKCRYLLSTTCPYSQRRAQLGGLLAASNFDGPQSDEPWETVALALLNWAGYATGLAILRYTCSGIAKWCLGMPFLRRDWIQTDHQPPSEIVSCRHQIPRGVAPVLCPDSCALLPWRPVNHMMEH